MSETSTLGGDCSNNEQSVGGAKYDLRKSLPRLSIPERQETKTPLLLQPRQDRWQEDTGLSDLPMGSSTGLITFFNKHLRPFPRAIISDQKLCRELADWTNFTLPNAPAPSTPKLYRVDNLLSLLTNFTRQRGSTSDLEHVLDLLQLVCVHLLEEFQTPTTFRSQNIHSRYYYAIRLALHHHRNHLIQTKKGSEQQVGRLSAWSSEKDHVTLRIWSLDRELISCRLSWQEACDPASPLVNFPPLSRREVSAYNPPTSTLFDPLVANIRRYLAIEIHFVPRLAHFQCRGRSILQPCYELIVLA